jgi:succinoglycan biosynthesis transport protein ExoP
MENALVPVPHTDIEPRFGYPAALPDSVDAPPTGGLLEYGRMLRRHKGAMILISFLGVLAAVLITLPQTPVYQARASLEIQDINKEFMNLKQVSPVSENSDSSALSDMETQIKILKSDLLAERTLAKLKISTAAGLNLKESRLATWRRALHIPESEPSPSRQAMLEAFSKNLKVRVAGQTRIVELLVDSTDPAIAAALANTLASEYIDQNVEARWQMSQRTGDWLGRQLDDMRIKLERSEDALQSYARQNSLLFTAEREGGDKQNVSEEKLHQLQAELSKAEAERVGRQSRYETTRTATPETLPDVVNDSNLADLQKKITDLRREDAELATTFKPDYSKSKKVRAEIASLETALAREQKAIVDRIGNEYQESLRREKLLAASYAAQVRLVTQDSEKSIQYNILKREVDSNRQIYEATLQRVKESTIASALRASNIRVIDSAKVPEVPYKPSLAMNAAIGLLSGLILGFGFVVMRERGDRTIQEPGDASYFLGLPELGVVPTASIGKRVVIRVGRKKRTASRTSMLLPARALLPADKKTLTKPRIQLTSWQRNPSLVSEGFRSVLASIMFAGHNGNRPRVLVITSAGPMEGKTTTASNLAIGFAKINQRVLLIDGDLRKPSLHEIFELDNSDGLLDLLKDRQLDEDAAGTLVRETPIPNLYVLTSGGQVGVGLNLLFSSLVPSLIALYKKQYDIVIIDTPPMLHMPDARLLGRMADAVVLVVRAGRTSRDGASAARQILAQDNTRVLGVVLNDWNPKSSPDGYYGAYNKRYYTGYHAPERAVRTAES